MIRFKPIPKDIHQKMNPLIDFFKADPHIIFAYIFGGLARERQNPLSDVDLAVYVKDARKIDYLELFGNIANIIGTDEIDLVVLNAAPISLAGRILQATRTY
jgi:predicted nucleotidyltransferase